MFKKLKQKQVARGNQTQKSEAGFTILETAIALVLLAIIGLGAASLFVYATRNTMTEGDRELAMAVAQQSMEQLRNVPFTDPSLASTAGTTSIVTRAGQQYTVRTEIADSNVVNGAPTTKTITIRVRPTRSGTSNTPNTVNTYFGGVLLMSQRTSVLIGPNRTP